MIKTCSMCHMERGCNETMPLNELNEFIEGVQKTFQQDEDEDGEQEQTVTDKLCRNTFS